MDSGTILSNTPHIIECMFKNLSALDLCRCACVNKLWNHFSTIEINQRKKKTVFFYQTLKCCIHKRDHTIIKDCTMRNAGRFEEELDLQIRNLEVKPAFCIAFANLTFWENFESLFPSHPISKPKCKRFKKAFDDTSRQNYLESVIKTALKKRLPRNCQIGFYLGRAIVDAESDFDRVHEDKQVPSISGYFIPELPQGGIQFCKRRNYDREVYRTIATHSDMKSALALIEHKSIAYFAYGLKQIQEQFDVFKEGIVFPVQIGSDVVPMFFGSNVETAIVKIPISNETDSTRVERLEKNGAVALVFGPCYSICMSALEEFRQEYPLIPIVGLCSHCEKDFESTDEADFYIRLMKNVISLNYECKCMLISIKY